jgi:hypothetical protein
MLGQRKNTAATPFYTLKQNSVNVDEWHGGKVPLMNKIGTGKAFVVCVISRKQEPCRNFQLQKYRNL